MDSITQAVLGAAIGEAILGKKIGNKAAISGAIIATIPDLDVFLYLFYDKFEMLSIHRGLSHSLLGIFVGTLLIAFILSRIKPFRAIKPATLLLFVGLCLFTHVLLDTFTAYGTQLFLPFSNQRLGFDSINVVDPLYTIPLIIGLFLSTYIYKSSEKGAKYNNYGLIISSLYLVFTLLNKQRVNADIAAQLAEQNIQYKDLLTMPVGIANINWYGVAKSQDSIFMLKYAPFADDNKSIESFPIHEQYLNLIDKEVADKMRWFAKGFYTVDKENENIRVYNLQVDMRGITKVGNKKAPTAGYFEISNQNGKTNFSSGSIKKQTD